MRLLGPEADAKLKRRNYPLAPEAGHSEATAKPKLKRMLRKPKLHGREAGETRSWIFPVSDEVDAEYVPTDLENSIASASNLSSAWAARGTHDIIFARTQKAPRSRQACAHAFGGTACLDSPDFRNPRARCDISQGHIVPAGP
eukprot:gene3546-biopygen11683